MKLEGPVHVQLIPRAVIYMYHLGILLLLVLPSCNGRNDMMNETTEAPVVIAPLSEAPIVALIPVTAPSVVPSLFPSQSLTPTETEEPTLPVPSLAPSQTPGPSNTPSTGEPSETPGPTGMPSLDPSGAPSLLPSVQPSESVPPTESFSPSFRPSEPPTMIPTETQRPSPSPSDIPSYLPSGSLLPTATPSISLFPSISRVPSATPSDTPTTASPSLTPSSHPPSVNPSVAPSLTPSTFPSEMPTSFPSSAPTVTMMDLSRAVITMTITGIPTITNETKLRIWEEETSHHVEQYWNTRPRPAIVIVSDSVVTTLIDPGVIGRRRGRGLQIGLPVANFSYSQSLRFGYLMPDSSIADNEDVIFTRPFRLSQQDYIDSLIDAWQLPIDPDPALVSISAIEIVDDGTARPTFPPTPTSSPAPGGASSATIVVSTLLAVLVLSALLIVGYLMLSRRKRENQINWATENNREFNGEQLSFDQEENPPSRIQVPTTSYNSNNNNNNQSDEGEIDVAPFSMGADSFADAGQEDAPYDDYEEPIASMLEPSNSSPPNLLGGADYDSEDDDDDDDAELDPFAHPPTTPMMEQHDLNRTASYGSGSMDDSPSLSAFNVTVIDIDDIDDDL